MSNEPSGHAKCPVGMYGHLATDAMGNILQQTAGDSLQMMELRGIEPIINSIYLLNLLITSIATPFLNKAEANVCLVLLLAIKLHSSLKLSLISILFTVNSVSLPLKIRMPFLFIVYNTIMHMSKNL